jgi:hypothetical protein
MATKAKTLKDFMYCNYPRWRSRYSDWLLARLSTSMSSNPDWVKNFIFTRASSPILGSIKPSGDSIPRGKAV